MSKVSILICFTFLFFKQGFAQTDITVIRNVNVFTGTEYLEQTNLIFRDSVIVKISKKVPKYKSLRVIDGTGNTIIPPLVNAHVHLWQPESLVASLKAGVFVNLDMHNTDEGANFLRSFNDSLNYSSFYSSNSAVTVPGGHGTQFGFPVPTINDSISAEKFVQDRLTANADYIKVIREPRMNSLTDQQSSDAINEAHKSGVLAVGHSHNIGESITLTEQGIDGLMHIWYDKPADETFLLKMKGSEIFIVPTLLATQKVLELAKQQGWAKYVLSFEKVLEEVKRAYDAGITIICGTDPPNLGVNYTDNLFDEMELLSKAGLTNIEILKSASINTYDAFRLEELGELKEGVLANFVLIDGNPIERISDLKSDKVIFRKGQQIQ